MVVDSHGQRCIPFIGESLQNLMSITLLVEDALKLTMQSIGLLCLALLQLNSSFNRLNIKLLSTYTVYSIAKF